MTAQVGEFLEHTSVYLLLGFLLAALFCAWSLARRWYDPALKEITREALIGVLFLLIGTAIHFGALYVVRRHPAVDFDDATVLGALVVRTILVAAGLLVVVRAWTRTNCGERGWIALAAICVAGGTAVDMLMP